MNKQMSFAEMAEERKDLDAFIRDIVLKIAPDKKEKVADILLGVAIGSEAANKPPDGSRAS